VPEIAEFLALRTAERAVLRAETLGILPDIWLREGVIFEKFILSRNFSKNHQLCVLCASAREIFFFF